METDTKQPIEYELMTKEEANDAPNDAAFAGDVEALKAALAAGADVNVVDVTERTPLLVASMNGYVEAMKALLEAGADVDAVDSDGDTALISILQYGV